MKSEKEHLILGSVFLIAGGFIVTLERLINHVYWLGQVHTGAFPTVPESGVFSNLFVSLFLLIGVNFFILYFKDYFKEIH